MSRKRTGLRNRHRAGQSTYSQRNKRNKRRDADQYGTWMQGRRTKPEIIAGHPMGSTATERAA